MVKDVWYSRRMRAASKPRSFNMFLTVSYRKPMTLPTNTVRSRSVFLRATEDVENATLRGRREAPRANALLEVDCKRSMFESMIMELLVKGMRNAARCFVSGYGGPRLCRAPAFQHGWHKFTVT